MRSPMGLVRKALWTMAGLVCVAIGAIGVIVPGLPSTVFFIAATACFARSNERLERWVLGLPGIGRAVQNYRAGLGMPRAAKRVAIVSIAVFSTLSVVVLGPPALRIAVAALGATGIWYVGWRVPTTPPGAVASADRSTTTAS